MEPVKYKRRGRSTKGPEAIVEQKIIDFLERKGWFVQRLHGSTYQAGMPDLFCCHARYGTRLVEVKEPNRQGDLFTPAQKRIFPQLVRNGCPVIILTGIDDEKYRLLISNKSNYWKYISIVKEYRK